MRDKRVESNRAFFALLWFCAAMVVRGETYNFSLVGGDFSTDAGWAEAYAAGKATIDRLPSASDSVKFTAAGMYRATEDCEFQTILNSGISYGFDFTGVTPNPKITLNDNYNYNWQSYSRTFKGGTWDLTGHSIYAQGEDRCFGLFDGVVVTNVSGFYAAAFDEAKCYLSNTTVYADTFYLDYASKANNASNARVYVADGSRVVAKTLEFNYTLGQNDVMTVEDSTVTVDKTLVEGTGNAVIFAGGSTFTNRNAVCDGTSISNLVEVRDGASAWIGTTIMGGSDGRFRFVGAGTTATITGLVTMAGGYCNLTEIADGASVACNGMKITGNTNAVRVAGENTRFSVAASSKKYDFFNSNSIACEFILDDHVTFTRDTTTYLLNNQSNKRNRLRVMNGARFVINSSFAFGVSTPKGLVGGGEHVMEITSGGSLICANAYLLEDSKDNSIILSNGYLGVTKGGLNLGGHNTTSTSQYIITNNVLTIAGTNSQINVSGNFLTSNAFKIVYCLERQLPVRTPIVAAGNVKLESDTIIDFDCSIREVFAGHHGKAVTLMECTGASASITVPQAVIEATNAKIAPANMYIEGKALKVCYPVETSYAVDDSREPYVKTVTVSNGWIDANVPLDKTINDTPENGNGFTYWKNYVLGMNPNDPNSKPIIKGVQNANPEKLAFALGNVNYNADSGVKVTYTVNEYTALDSKDFKNRGSTNAGEVIEFSLPTEGILHYYRAVIEYSN